MVDQMHSDVSRNMSLLSLGSVFCANFSSWQALSTWQKGPQQLRPQGRRTGFVSALLLSHLCPQIHRLARSMLSLGQAWVLCIPVEHILWIQPINDGGWFFDRNSQPATWKGEMHARQANDIIRHLLQNFKQFQRYKISTHGVAQRGHLQVKGVVAGLTWKLWCSVFRGRRKRSLMRKQMPNS